MKKEITIDVCFTNKEMVTIRDVLFYSWEDDKFLRMDKTGGKVIVALANVNYFTVKEETEVDDAEIH